MERLLREFVRVLEQSWPRPDASASWPPPILDRASAEAPSVRAADEPATILDLPYSDLAAARRNGEEPMAWKAPGRHAPAPSVSPQDHRVQRVAAPQDEAASNVSGAAARPPTPATLPDIEDFEIPALNLPEFDLPELDLPEIPPEGADPAAPARQESARPTQPKEAKAPPQSARRTSNRLDLELPCPECGEKIFAPVGQLGRQMVCKACDAKLFMQSNGALVAGAAPERHHRGGDNLWSPVSYNREQADRLGRYLELWQKVPRSAQIAAAAAVFLLCLGLLGWAMNGPELPETLTERAEFVGKAFAWNDEGQILALASPDSERNVTKWFRKARPNFWRGKIRDVRVKVNVFHQDTRNGKAATLVTVNVTDAAGGFSPLPALDSLPQTVAGNLPAPAVKSPSNPVVKGRPPPAVKGVPKGAPASPAGRAPGSNTAPALVKDSRETTLRLFWVLDQQGQWRLDGHKTLMATDNLSR